MSAQKALSANPGLFGESPTSTNFNKGLRIVAYKARRQIFVSSRLNTFGGIRYKRVKLDHGADGVLLYFPTKVSISDMGNKFRNFQFRVSIETGNGIGSRFPILVVSHIRSKPFKIKFCTDLLPENKPFSVLKLQFILCKDDVNDIASDAALAHVRTMLSNTHSLEKINSLSANSTSLAGRRTHVLVGQSVLDDLSLHEHAKLHVAYDYDFGYTGDWDTLCFTIRDQLLSSGGYLEEEFYSELAAEPNEDAAWEEMVGMDNTEGKSCKNHSLHSQGCSNRTHMVCM